MLIVASSARAWEMWLPKSWVVQCPCLWLQIKAIGLGRLRVTRMGSNRSSNQSMWPVAILMLSGEFHSSLAEWGYQDSTAPCMGLEIIAPMNTECLTLSVVFRSR